MNDTQSTSPQPSALTVTVMPGAGQVRTQMSLAALGPWFTLIEATRENHEHLAIVVSRAEGSTDEPYLLQVGRGPVACEQGWPVLSMVPLTDDGDHASYMYQDIPAGTRIAARASMPVNIAAYVLTFMSASHS